MAISLSYIHRSQPLWRKSPFSNIWWCLTVPVVYVQSARLTLDLLAAQILVSLQRALFNLHLLVTRLLGQVVQAAVDYQLWHDQSSPLTFTLDNIPLEAWLMASLSLLLVVVVNEVTKLHEIRYETKVVFT